MVQQNPSLQDGAFISLNPPEVARPGSGGGGGTVGYGSSFAALSAAASKYSNELYNPPPGESASPPYSAPRAAKHLATEGVDKNSPRRASTSLPAPRLPAASSSNPIDYAHASDPYFPQAHQFSPDVQLTGEYRAEEGNAGKRKERAGSLVPERERDAEEAKEGEDDEGNEGSARPLKATKRAAQNRSAQRAFRERKEQYVRELERKSAMLDETLVRERELSDRLAVLETSPDLLDRERESWMRERESWLTEKKNWIVERETLMLQMDRYLKENEGLKGALEESRRMNRELAGRP